MVLLERVIFRLLYHPLHNAGSMEKFTDSYKLFQ